MPNKIAEAQFCHVAEKEGLLSLGLSLNGDPIDPEVLDNVAFEVHQRFKERRARAAVPPTPTRNGALLPGSADSAAFPPRRCRGRHPGAPESSPHAPRLVRRNCPSAAALPQLWTSECRT
jgi:hypothetical protein